MRRSNMDRVGQYDGDVLFDNENCSALCSASRSLLASIIYPQAYSKLQKVRAAAAPGYEDFVMQLKPRIPCCAPVLCLSISARSRGIILPHSHRLDFGSTRFVRAIA